MKCPRCQSESTVDARFCEECGRDGVTAEEGAIALGIAREIGHREWRAALARVAARLSDPELRRLFERSDAWREANTDQSS